MMATANRSAIITRPAVLSGGSDVCVNARGDLKQAACQGPVQSRHDFRGATWQVIET